MHNLSVCWNSIFRKIFIIPKVGVGKTIAVVLWSIGFLPARQYASAGNSDRNVSVRPSVRLSRAGIVSKRRKISS